MTNRPALVQALPQTTAPLLASSEIRIYRLGDYGLIDLVGAPPDSLQLRRALLWEWSVSAAGVIVRVNDHAPPDDRTVRAIVADAATLVRAWPGTPIGLITDRPDVCDLVARDPRGRHLVLGADLGELWHGMWSRGGKANITVELPSTRQAPHTARGIVTRACLDWHLNALVGPATVLVSGLVARSVIQGAEDIHLTVSRYNSRVRILARDDVPAATDQPTTVDDVFDTQFAAAGSAASIGSFREFAVDRHHVRWAVTRDHQSALIRL
jgi:hypothetical protein